jgi:5-methylcytosine-specific restriction endonuclease McrA
MKYNIKKERLEDVVKMSFSVAETLKKLEMPLAGGNYKLINKLVNEYQIDITHFTGQTWSKGKILEGKVKLDDIITNKVKFSRSQLKKRLIRDGLLEYKCVECGNEGEWNGKPISLEMDHINGINDDNRLENLRILCPNCHSQTPTFRIKNTSLRPKEVKIKIPKEFKVKTCECGKIIQKTSKTCEDCWHIKNRKIERPNTEVLKEELKESSYSAIGRKYGVSDNTIRKWVK